MPRTLTAEPAFQPTEAVTGQPLPLAMQDLMLTGTVFPTGAHLTVRHTFRSGATKPLEVVYACMLPRDAALRRFRLAGKDFSVHSELRPVEEAERTYERALAEGHLGSLARQFGDGLVNLSLGNLKPDETVTLWLEILAGVELNESGLRFRFPFTLAPSYHPKAKAAQWKPGVLEMELPREEFGDLILPPVHEKARDLHAIGFDLVLETGGRIQRVASPSHMIQVGSEGDRKWRTALAAAADVPDRDLVLDVQAATGAPLVCSGVAENRKRQFAVIVPAACFGEPPATPRSVVLLIDRSGSMSGEPMKQARSAVAACLSALEPEDQFGLVAFDDRVEIFEERLCAAGAKERKKAQAFLDRVEARGGTELATGVEAAAKMLRGERGDILILTDGQVFGGEAILERARQSGYRVHSLGIGSASQDRFLALLARETGGVSRFVTLDERVDLAALELFAAASRPVATELAAEVVSGSVSPEPPPAVFAGTPVLLMGECDAGSVQLQLKYKSGGEWRERPVDLVDGGDTADAEILRLLRGSRLLTDADARLISTQGKEKARMEAWIERLSLEYGLASQRMALVAVVERPGDQPGEPPKTQVVPVGLPRGMEMAGLAGAPPMLSPTFAMPAPAAGPTLGSPSISFASAAGEMKRGFTVKAQKLLHFAREMAPAPPQQTDEKSENLFALAAQIEPDGGLPGRNDEHRILATLAALLKFASDGSSLTSGPFRLHVQKLVRYLESGVLGVLDIPRRRAVEAILQALRQGGRLPDPPHSWRDIQDV